MLKKKTKKEMTLDDLALMVAKGFNDMNEKMDNEFKGVRTDIKVLRTDVNEIKSDTKYIKAELNKKVDKVKYNILTYRVEKLEKKCA